MSRIPLLIIGAIGVAAVAVSCTAAPPPAPPLAPAAAGVLSSPAAAFQTLRRPGPQCDPTLWQHVYTGDPRRFSKPQDRLQVITACVEVSGVIETAKPEPDGDFHIRLKLDPQFEGMLNAKNKSGQHGDLVLEPVCSNPVSQRDTIDEGVCNGFNQNIYQHSMLHKHVTVTGVYVTDLEHGWNEIHPVTSITVSEPTTVSVRNP
jgi:hypothetical protein